MHPTSIQARSQSSGLDGTFCCYGNVGLLIFFSFAILLAGPLKRVVEINKSWLRKGTLNFRGECDKKSVGFTMHSRFVFMLPGFLFYNQPRSTRQAPSAIWHHTINNQNWRLRYTPFFSRKCQMASTAAVDPNQNKYIRVTRSLLVTNVSICAPSYALFFSVTQNNSGLTQQKKLSINATQKNHVFFCTRKKTASAQLSQRPSFLLAYARSIRATELYFTIISHAIIITS